MPVNRDAGLQRRLDAILMATGAPDAAPPAPSFSPFFGDGAARAGALATELRGVAQTEGLEAAIALAEEAARTEPAGLVKRAVKVFVTHEPLATGRLVLPAVEALESIAIQGRPPPPRTPPGGALPPGIPGAPPRSEAPRRSGRAEAAPPPVDMPDSWDAQAVPSLTEPAAERALDWYREDPFANDHHAHWHIVYPRDGGGPSVIQRRHGELFFYMHEQMLARYDAERVVAGLERVKPHPRTDAQGRPDYGASIPEGYGSAGYTRRLPGRSFSEVPGAVADATTRHEGLTAAIAAGRLDFRDRTALGPLTERTLVSAWWISGRLKPSSETSTAPGTVTWGAWARHPTPGGGAGS
jgi:tyrosinase